MTTHESIAPPPTILIIDDRPDRLGAMVSALESSGFRVALAQDGEAGLAAAAELAPDLVLLDVMMPCMDGFETCRALKAQPSTADTPVIFMTSLAETDSKVAGFEAGAVDYVTKPFDLAEVLARVKTHLALRAMRARLAAQNEALRREQEARARLNEALQEKMEHLDRLSHRLVMVQEEERRRLASTLHDRVAPNLAILKIDLELLRDAVARGETGDLDTRLADASALVDDTGACVREICTDLRPAVLDYYGLFRAIDSYAQQFAVRTGIAVAVKGAEGAARLPPDHESALFRIVQEALTNCAKHAGACKVAIELAHDERAARLTIADDGVGFDPRRLAAGGQSPGLGLLTMRERAEFAGGAFHLKSRPGRGTRITVEIGAVDQK